MTLAFAALTSCSDDNSVDLSNRLYVLTNHRFIWRLTKLPQLPLLLMTWQAIPIS